MRILKKAFTLAEVLITLIVIGVITAVIIPVAIHSKPDENVMKFKKAHNTLYQVISELVNSDKYYLDGNLGILSNGSNAGKSAFCLNFADLVSSKKTVCNYSTNEVSAFEATCTYESASICNTVNNGIERRLDNNCINAQKNFSGTDIGVKTTDDVYFYEANLNNFFGCRYQVDCAIKNTTGGWDAYAGKNLFGGDQIDLAQFDTGVKQLRNYKTFCIDIDGINKGEDPFGYGIRADGKIMVGNRATEWLSKPIQGEN